MVIAINECAAIPIYMQIRDQIVMGISSGELKEGDRLPTVRALALEIGVNTMTVSKAYQLLKQEGYVVTERRSGVRIRAVNMKKQLNEESEHLLNRIASEAKVCGMSEEEFIEQCKNAYRGGMV